jgi:hypothetical protein
MPQSSTVDLHRLTLWDLRLLADMTLLVWTTSAKPLGSPTTIGHTTSRQMAVRLHPPSDDLTAIPQYWCCTVPHSQLESEFIRNKSVAL